jgi:hypothetical protein
MAKRGNPAYFAYTRRLEQYVANGASNALCNGLPSAIPSHALESVLFYGTESRVGCLTYVMEPRRSFHGLHPEAVFAVDRYTTCRKMG